MNKRNNKNGETICNTLHRRLKSSNTNRTKNRWWTQVLMKGKQFLLHMWHPSSNSCIKPDDKSLMRKGPDCDYNKRNR